MAGEMTDCREMTGAPWELPLKEQHVAGEFLKKLQVPDAASFVFVL